MTVVFSHIEPEEAEAAYQWHREFAESDDHIFPRPWDHYRQLAEDGRIVCAREDGEFVGLCYYAQDGNSWEVGGLMVAASQQGRGVGLTLMAITLGNLLIDEDPLSRDESVITHVHECNQAPRKIIKDYLQFEKRGEVHRPGHELPGLKVDEHGIVNGDEFHLVRPNTLLALADWCDGWRDQLGNGTPARIELRESLTLALWAQAFREMADNPAGF